MCHPIFAKLVGSTKKSIAKSRDELLVLKQKRRREKNKAGVSHWQ
jgi:hypothetical protein